jgi:hypothetical protein
MPATGPGDKPLRPRRGRRKPASPAPRPAPTQTAAAAENQRQVQTGKVRGPRKTKASDYHAPRPVNNAPAYKPPVNDTKSNADLGRATKFKHTPKYRADVRAVYHAATPERKQELADQADKRSIEGRIILEEHAARKRLIDAASNTGGDFGPHLSIDTSTPEGRRLAQSATPIQPRKQITDLPGVTAGLKVLEQTTRPLHALAGAAKADVKVIQDKGLSTYLQKGGGQAAIDAASRGIQNKDKVTFSDVLKEAGRKKQDGPWCGRICSGRCT